MKEIIIKVTGNEHYPVIHTATRLIEITGGGGIDCPCWAQRYYPAEGLMVSVDEKNGLALIYDLDSAESDPDAIYQGRIL